MDQNKIYVYAGWENDIKIGTIYSEILNGTEIISFEYDNKWLLSCKHEGALSFSCNHFVVTV